MQKAERCSDVQFGAGHTWSTRSGIWKAGLGEEDHANSEGHQSLSPPSHFQWGIDMWLWRKELGGWINLENATKAIPLWDSQSTSAYKRFWENPLRKKSLLEFIYLTYSVPQSSLSFPHIMPMNISHTVHEKKVSRETQLGLVFRNYQEVNFDRIDHISHHSGWPKTTGCLVRLGVLNH